MYTTTRPVMKYRTDLDVKARDRISILRLRMKKGGRGVKNLVKSTFFFFFSSELLIRVLNLDLINRIKIEIIGVGERTSR